MSLFEGQDQSITACKQFRVRVSEKAYLKRSKDRGFPDPELLYYRSYLARAQCGAEHTYGLQENRKKSNGPETG